MKLSGIKFNITTIVIIIVVLLFLIALGWYFYKRGKNQVTLQYLPGELPGNPQSGTQIGASNDEIKTIAAELYNDMKGPNFLGHNYDPYNRANLLNDSDLIKLYNAFNAMYQKQYGQTLTQFIESDWFLENSPPHILYKRLKKLNAI